MGIMHYAYTDSSQLREDRPRQREQLIKERRMNPDGPMLLSQAVKLVGICMEMCPEYERVRRIVEEDLKLPEYVRIAHAILSTCG